MKANPEGDHTTVCWSSLGQCSNESNAGELLVISEAKLVFHRL